MQRGLVTVLHQPCVEVAGYAPVAACISTVGGNIHLYQVVALQVVVLLGRYAHGGVLGQHDDTVVAGANAYLVLGTDHAQTFHTAQLAALDNELLVAIVQFGAHYGNNHLLSGRHIGSTAHNLQGSILSHIYGADMHVVAIGMLFASEHLACPQAFQSSLYALNFLHTAYLQTYAGQCFCHLFGREVYVYVFTKPFIGYIHISI